MVAYCSTDNSADIVRDAISASGGLGEPWCVDGVNAVRVGDVLFVIDVDDLGWAVTAYVIDGGEAEWSRSWLRRKATRCGR